ncbi:AP-1 complex subunit mu [Hondaea fermentalgiana]|uniref:AP-1 complex subunit mu n=1 Tax=Hondaea fermentalgiana TaxID=2315210 RepID=A0A2R5G9P5_9STRA|nr:AP-1 complex subunit mu [Hondaea fermentalgiana]|eukprot:GBG26448.1 AP-1 complex subunit mu [Hondaea fermentalgiana]
MQSLFILSDSGEVLIEKHWRKVTSRNLVDLFLHEVARCGDPADVVPVISTANLYLVNVYRSKLFLLCVLGGEQPPLLVMEFMHRVMDVFEEYIGQVDDVSIKENFSTFYQLLEEMCDNGFPMTTESNALKERIAPPSISGRIAAAVSGKSAVADELPVGQPSPVPWRRQGVRYNVNSIYLDIVESIDCIIGRNGAIVSCEVNGELLCTSKLSGVPDLSLSFNDPWILRDFSLHPCVRTTRFEQDRTLSFIPPDGAFTLMKYSVDPRQFSSEGPSSGRRTFGNVPLPIYCKPQITSSSREEGRIEVMVGSKPLAHLLPPKKSNEVEKITIIIPFPKTVRSTDLKSSHGVVMCDETTKECRWEIGKMPRDGSCKLTGAFTFLPGSPAFDETLTVLLQFKLADCSVSKISVSDLQVNRESYVPYKYVRSILKAERVEVRA